MIRAICPVPVLNLMYDKTMVPVAAALLSAFRQITKNNRELVILHKSTTALNGATLNLQLVEAGEEIRYTDFGLICEPSFGIIFAPEKISTEDAHDLAMAFLIMLGVQIPETQK